MWRRFLYANLLADKEVIADTIIQRFAAEDSIGLVFPDDPNIIGWGRTALCPHPCKSRTSKLLQSLPETTFNFPVGNMFWARTAALKPLLQLGLTWTCLSGGTSSLRWQSASRHRENSAFRCAQGWLS